MNDRRGNGARALAGWLVLLALVPGSGCGGEEPVPERPSIEELRALPYVSQTPVRQVDRGKLGVQVHDTAAAYPGINVDCAESREGARLLDMQGRVLHTIATPPCKLIEPYDDRDFLVLAYPWGVQRIDWDSQVIWSNDGMYHHDLDVTANGDIWVISTRRGKVLHRGRVLEFMDDGLALLGPDGARKDWFSLFVTLKPLLSPEPLDRLYEAVEAGRPVMVADDVSLEDVLHANTVEILDRDSALGPAGSILTCARHADLLAVVDPRSREVTWSYGPGVLDMPHQPTVLPSGNLLIFDNGARRGWSRIIELEPASRRIVWEYRRDDPLFYTRSRGSAQPLPNGNVLAAESDRGRVFEVTRDGRIVWEYWAPESREADGSFMRKTIYRAARWTPELVRNPEFEALWRSLERSR